MPVIYQMQKSIKEATEADQQVARLSTEEMNAMSQVN